MKEFDYKLDNVFKGIAPEKVVRKSNVTLLDCHNLEPVKGDDYQLHEKVIDMNTDNYAWGNA